jgi:hypothetical protein
MAAARPLTSAEWCFLEASANGAIADFSAIESLANRPVEVADASPIDTPADQGISPADRTNQQGRVAEFVRTEQRTLSGNVDRTDHQGRAVDIVRTDDRTLPADVKQTDRRTLSADVVRTLLTRSNPAWSVTRAGVCVVGARITGVLDLAGATIDFPIAFVNCHFDQELSLRGATLQSVFLGGSDVPGIDAASLHVHGDVQLCDGFRAHGSVRFDRAIVDGNFSLNGALLDSHNRAALPADSLDSNVRSDPATEITFSGQASNRAGLVGDSTFSSSSELLNSGRSYAFFADEVTIHGHLLMSNGFHSVGEVSVRRTHIGGMFYCSHGRFANPGAVAIATDEAVIDGDIVMSNGFVANGEVSIRRARLRRHLYCLHGTFKNPGGNALSADAAEVGGRAYLGDWFAAQGAVLLCDAKVAGDLYCVGGIFQNSGGDALCANGISVGGNVRMHTRFLAQGAVRLADARIAGALNCDGGHFENADGVALTLEGAEIGRNAIIGGAFRASGTVDFTGAKIGGALDTEGPKFDKLITGGVSIGER